MSRFGGGDDDLNDLIGSGEKGAGGGGGERSQMKPLNLDHLAEGELDVPVKRTGGGGGGGFDCSLLKLCCAYVAYMCDYAPKFCWAIGVAALLIPAYFLMMAVFFNPTEHFGVINDYSGINSQYDLTVGKIDHWCLKGDNDSCRCEDPLEPQSRGEFRGWTKAQVANTKLVQGLIDQGQGSPDIAFLGASVIEEMSGKWFGDVMDDNLKGLQTLFEKNFKKSEGSELDAVALGVAGDTSPTILWRLMNGEMPPAFTPKIWWLEIGLNDLGRSQCSEEVVVLGVLRVVEEILDKKKDAIIVINSLFPLADLRGGVRPNAADYKDSFNKDLRQRATDKMNKPHNRQEKHANRNGGNKDAGATDHGDSTVVKGVHPKVDDKQKKRDDKQKKRDKKRKEKQAGGGRLLEMATDGTQEQRQLIFQWGRNKEGKEVKMKAHKDVQKKFNPVTHHERKLPLWTSVSAINTQLKKFASKHDQVYFFDATEIFTEREDNDTYILKTDMISIRGHPSRKGYEKWEEAVKVKAKSLLAGTEN